MGIGARLSGLISRLMGRAGTTIPRPEGPRGPDGWENWHAALRGLPAAEAFEVALYTDSRLTGEIEEGLGPYMLLNTVPAGFTADAGYAEPALSLRVGQHDDYEAPFTREDWKKPELGSYHGGSLGDEFAALISLALGIRLRSGGLTRTFGMLNEDPRGKPAEWQHRRPPLQAPRRGNDSALPRIAREISLDGAIPFLESYPTLAPQDAIALVRSARAYERGLWIADDDPGRSWLELVGAVEVAAVHWRESLAGDPLTSLTQNAPKIAKALEPAGAEVAGAVANELAHLLGSTSRFLKFLDEFVPDPPQPRPTTFALDWTKLKKAFRAIYERRSEALHGGAPIPWPMTLPPGEDSNGALEEFSGGIGSWSGGAYWPADATPMYLNTFAYIVRGALTKWWTSMTVGQTAQRSNP